jgi:hypothetical protein
MADSSQSEGKLKGSKEVERTGLNAWHRAIAYSEFEECQGGVHEHGKKILLRRGKSMERRPRDFGSPVQQRVKRRLGYSAKANSHTRRYPEAKTVTIPIEMSQLSKRTCTQSIEAQCC